MKPPGNKNKTLGRIKTACYGFARITTYGHSHAQGPTHFGCGPGFPKDRSRSGNPGLRRNPLPGRGERSSST